MRVGLVMSGGGAKGAYQAGVVAALADMNVEVDVVSGASIGSLNGAIVAAAPNINEAAKRLGEVWVDVARIPPLEFERKNIPRYLSLLVSAGLSGGTIPFRLALHMLSSVALKKVGVGDEETGLLKDSRLSQLLNEYLAPDLLKENNPLYVSLYPHESHLDSVKNAIKGELLGGKTRESVFKLVNALPEDERHNALMASAAIPVLFKPKKVEGQVFSDGGQGNYKKVQGNTPITPLLGKALDVIIVSHLSDGALWDVDDFPGENILELRPGEIISDSAKDMLGFEEEKIASWMEQGKKDTLNQLQSVLKIARARNAMKSSELSSLDIIENGMSSASLEATMKKFSK